jgi:hypothetical protein
MESGLNMESAKAASGARNYPFTFVAPRDSNLECGDMSPPSPDATSRVHPNRSQACALPKRQISSLQFTGQHFVVLRHQADARIGG